MTGDGTKANPYVVSTWNELMTVLPQENKYAVLGADIDMKNETITNSGVVLACDFDGQNHVIKNVYLSSENLQEAELFRMYYANSFRNVKFLNWYVNDRNVFSGDSSHPSYRPMPTIENFLFSGELVEQGRLVYLYSSMYIPTFKKSGIFILSHDIFSVISVGERYKPIFEDCDIQVYGECTGRILSATLNNSHLSGSVTFKSSASYQKAALEISSQGNYQSLIDLNVKSQDAWNAQFDGSNLLVETDLFENCTTSGTFIPCTMLEKTNPTFLAQHGFTLGDTLSAYSWNDWLASISSTAYYDTSSNEQFLTYNTNNGKYNINLVNLPNGCYTRNMPVWEWQYGEYYFSASSFKKYKVVVDAELPDGVIPHVRFFKNGDGGDWSLSGTGNTVIINAPDSTSSFTVNIGVINRTGQDITEDVTIEKVTIYEHSSWEIINGILTNINIPSANPIGAFCNDNSLSVVSIPRSVKKIGRFAFRNTSLTSVMIAQDCEYYPTSFPDGCTINFYPD